jgi:hypothetical protein
MAYMTYTMVCCVLCGYTMAYMTYPMVCCVLCGLHHDKHDLPYGVLCLYAEEEAGSEVLDVLNTGSVSWLLLLLLCQVT